MSLHFIRSFCTNISQRWNSIDRIQTLVVCLGFFVALLAIMHRYFWLPPYWDGIANFYMADEIRAHLLWPFRERWDTGHPTLVAWMVAALSRLGVSLISSFHVVMLFFAAMLIAAIWKLGKALGSEVVGWASALLLILHPFVLSQSLQLNLDLPMTACATMTMACLAAGNGWGAGLAGAAMCLCKMNGVFGMLPIGLISVWILWRRPVWRTGEGIRTILKANALPMLLAGGYFLYKRLAIGRIGDSGDFENGHQMDLVTSLPQYWGNLVHSKDLTLAMGAMKLFSAAILIGLVLRFLSHASWARQPKIQCNNPDGFRFCQRDIFLMLSAMAVMQILLQSIRAIPTLPRYFMICYPAFILGAVYLLWNARIPLRAPIFGIVMIFLAASMVIRWHPSFWLALPWQYHNTFGAPYQTNHEWDMGFIGVLRDARRAAHYLKDKGFATEKLSASWPFNVYLKDARMGFVKNDRPKESQPGQPQLIFMVKFTNPKLASILNHPDWKLIWGREKVTGAMGLYRSDPGKNLPVRDLF